MATRAVEESLKSKLVPLYFVELKSWNFAGSVCLLPYASLMAVKMVMMLVMSSLSFLVTTACAGLNPRLQFSCCPMSDKETLSLFEVEF